MAAKCRDSPIKAVDLVLKMKEAMSIDRHIMATIYGITPFSEGDEYKKNCTTKTAEVMQGVDDPDHESRIKQEMNK